MVNHPNSDSTQSTREKVADYLDKGLTVREIAGLLGLTTQAIYKHTRSIEEASRVSR